MVILRIWPPSRPKGQPIGFSSIALNGQWGDAYMSTRRLKKGELRTGMQGETATLADDIAGGGGDTGRIWRFTHLDEARMLRLWGQRRDLADTEWTDRANYQNNCFRFCDMVLSAGQGIAVEPMAAVSYSKRAEGALRIATLAIDHESLVARAEHALKFEHW